MDSEGYLKMVMETLGGSGGESFWEEGDDFGVNVLRFHTCLTDILGFLEKLKWWFEQDIDDEGEEDEEGKGGSEVLVLSLISVLIGDFEFLGCFGCVRRCKEEGVVPNILGAAGDMGVALSKAFWTSTRGQYPTWVSLAVMFKGVSVSLGVRLMRNCCFVIVGRDAWLEGVSGFGMGKVVLITFEELQMLGFFLQMGFTLILATLDGLDVGLLGDVIGEDDCDEDKCGCIYSGGKV
ncbi:hypothetical protein Tco_0860758 [Tanacetum coccineum]|uniref:Uncharacterized protein n=1 Tax=Tanacetum coccineum TaxID=301880 RepID=A0ABQ5BFU3_9ASTR